MYNTEDYMERFTGFDIGSKDETVICLGQYVKGVLLIENFIREGKNVKKVKKVKLTKDQQTIADLTTKLDGTASLLMKAQYREAETEKQFRKTERDLDSAYKNNATTREELARVTMQVYEAISVLKTAECNCENTKILQRVIGVAQGRLESLCK